MLTLAEVTSAPTIRGAGVQCGFATSLAQLTSNMALLSIIWNVAGPERPIWSVLEDPTCWHKLLQAVPPDMKLRAARQRVSHIICTIVSNDRLGVFARNTIPGPSITDRLRFGADPCVLRAEMSVLLSRSSEIIGLTTLDVLFPVNLVLRHKFDPPRRF